MPWYSGITTRTSWPRAASAAGSAAATSASPPVWRNGATSDAVNKILIGPLPQSDGWLTAMWYPAPTGLT
jgi:hypothetical protein